MKTYRLTMLIAVFSLLCTVGRGEEKKHEPDPVLLNLKGKIEAVLPKGWSVERTDNELQIMKDAPVHALLIFPSMSGKEKAKPTRYSFTLTQVDRISPAQHADRKQHYANLKKEAHLLYRSAKINEIPHEIDKAPPWKFEYKPRSERESQAVDKYKALHASIKRLPDFYTGTHSYFFDQFIYEFADKSEQHECESVRKEVLSLFSEYKKQTSR